MITGRRRRNRIRMYKEKGERNEQKIRMKKRGGKGDEGGG